MVSKVLGGIFLPLYKFINRMLIVMCKVFFILVSSLLLLACSKRDSESIPTKNIYADMSVISTGESMVDHSLVEVRLYSGKGADSNIIELSEGDRLKVFADADEYALKEKAGVFDTYYEATLPRGNINTIYRISFIREENLSATESSVMLPDQFEFTSDTSVKLAQHENLNVAWAPFRLRELITVEYDFDCVSEAGNQFYIQETEDINDDGLQAINITKYLTENVMTCDGYIDFKRINKGELDPNFDKGGSIYAMQRRRIEVKIADPEL